MEPRYDAQKDVTRHGATDDQCCYEMQERYGWDLVEVDTPEDTEGSLGLDVDCVFKGKAEFPKSYYEADKDEEDYDA